jgi:flagellar biosynthesis protein FlhF
MNVKRFFGTTSRDAIKQVRAELGDEAIILSNREVDGGVEVIASTQDNITTMIEHTPQREKQLPPPPKTQTQPQPIAAPKDLSSLPTIARIAQAAQAKLFKAMTPVTPPPAQPDIRIFKPLEATSAETFAHFVMRSEDQRAAMAGASTPPVLPKPVRKQPPVETYVAPRLTEEKSRDSAPDSEVMSEIRHMKTMLQEQIDVLSWRERTSRRPLETKLISHMLSALADKLPADYNDVEATRWLHENLIRNLATLSAGGDIVERGGIYALVGPTGVGKTTTAAKLAARCVVKYGAKSLGLITVDGYRIGAEDQLRAYGKILGVTVHSARDAQSLGDLIAQMRDKHLVLIDTVGMGQRDARLTEQLQMLSAPGIERILFLNASAQGETLDDVVRVYTEQAHRRTKKVIVSKIDEAVKYGFVLDCLIRYKLEAQYVTNGQRVPEDLHPANPRYLVHRALKHNASAAFVLDESEVPLMMARQPARTDEVHIA